MESMPPPSENPRDRERMLAFALEWMPYGGGDAEDIMVTFGITPDVYFHRLQQLLTDSAQSVEADMQTVAALLDVCRRRLELAARPSARAKVGQ